MSRTMFTKAVNPTLASGVSFTQILSCIPVLAKLLDHQDTDVLTHTCWATAFIADGPNIRIQKIVDGGLVQKLVELMMHDDMNVRTPALRAVGNILTGDDSQTQVHALYYNSYTAV